MKISDLRVGPARGVRPSATPRHALAVMEASGHSMLPVIDANGELVGVITEPDTRLLLAPASSDGHPVLGAVVSAAMTPRPSALGLHDGLSRALRILGDVSWDALPVTDGRRLVGILSRDEAVAAEAVDVLTHAPPL